MCLKLVCSKEEEAITLHGAQAAQGHKLGIKSRGSGGLHPAGKVSHHKGGVSPQGSICVEVLQGSCRLVDRPTFPSGSCWSG